jgi:HEAT repeat protein
VVKKLDIEVPVPPAAGPYPGRMHAFEPGYEEPSKLLAGAAACGEGDRSERARLITRLQRRTDAAAFAAAGAARSPELALRLAAVEVLGQLGYAQGRPYREQTLPILVETADQAAEPRLLQAALAAIAHLGDVRALTTVLRYVAHRDAGVRRVVAFALSSVLDEADPAPAAVEALIALSRDSDEGVRDWATFGLGDLRGSDSPAIRDALFARLGDRAPAIAEQARTALAELADAQVRRDSFGHDRPHAADSPAAPRNTPRTRPE